MAKSGCSATAPILAVLGLKADLGWGSPNRVFGCEANPDRLQLYHSKAVGGEFFESHGDMAKMLDPVEEALNVIALVAKSV